MNAVQVLASLLQSGELDKALEQLDKVLYKRNRLSVKNTGYDWVFNFLYCFKEAVAAVKFLENLHSDIGAVWPNYFFSLKELCHREINVLEKFNPRLKTVAFIGCGALPLSCIFYAEAGLKVIGTDSRESAIFTATKVLGKLGFKNITLAADDGFSGKQPAEAIIISNTAGWSNEGKARLVDNLKKQHKDALILARVPSKAFKIQPMLSCKKNLILKGNKFHDLILVTEGSNFVKTNQDHHSVPA